MEQNLSAPETRLDSDVSLKPNLKPISDEEHGCFDCNICLDSANDPVVTLCGHLYCWPCIYKWLQVQSSNNDELENVRNCPVCKATISPNSLVPLYGRGISKTDSESKRSHLGMAVPRRPQPSRTNTLVAPSPGLRRHYLRPAAHSIYHNHPYFPQAYGNFAAYTPSYLGNAVITSLVNPTMEMFGESVLTRIFGGVDQNLLSQPYNPISGNGISPRMRRQEMQLDKSLNRVSIFLFCCFIICLLLF